MPWTRTDGTPVTMPKPVKIPQPTVRTTVQASGSAAGMNFLEAVAREEGFYIPGTRPNRNNNPGDIEAGRFTDAHGATASDGRFAIFASAVEGFSAMRALFQAPAYKGKTVAEALNRWAPPVENATSAYIANVCKWTGLTPDTVIDGHLA